MRATLALNGLKWIEAKKKRLTYFYDICFNIMPCANFFGILTSFQEVMNLQIRFK